MKKNLKKLRLTRETLHYLGDVQGGTGESDLCTQYCSGGEGCGGTNNTCVVCHVH